MSEDEGTSLLWQEVQALVARLEPRVIEVFQRNRLDPENAALILEEVVTLLLYRWGEVASPEAWMLEMLEHRAWNLRGSDSP
jgi:hypothetical protein